MTEDSFPRQNARTRRFTCGAPRSFSVAADGGRVVFLRSAGPTDPVNALWVLDLDTGIERLVADPADLLDPTGEELPAAERARRERARETSSGIVAYDVADDGRRAVFVLSGVVYVADLDEGTCALAGSEPGAFDPRLDPSGERIAYVAGPSLRLIDAEGDRVLVEEPGDTISWGAAEFVAAEEMGRTRGFWWGPDGDRLLVERVDVASVDVWYLSPVVDPDAAPTPIRYPAAGTANAEVSLWVVALDGSRVEVDWRRGEFEYLARVSWGRRERPTLAVQTRDQRTLAVLEVDPDTGQTVELSRDTDSDWVELVGGSPAWAGDRLVTVSDIGSARRVVVDGRPIGPENLQVRRVLSTTSDSVVVVATDDPTQAQVVRLGLDGAVEAITDVPGVHSAAIGSATVVVSSMNLDQPGATHVVHRDGRRVAVIDSLAATPVLTPRPTLHTVGERSLRMAVLFPSDDAGDRPLPVLLDPYGGPHALRVQQASGAFLASQWLADQGYAVIVADGRGTPARGPAWEREVRGDLATAVLDDQVDALREAAGRYPRLDLDRVAIRGWSFGGYLAALAVLRRPEVFHAAIAGAPVTDWRLYDTHYTERYLGHPDAEPESYERTDLARDAAALRRPLMLIHGLADDNVVAAHTLRLSRALLEAGRHHQVLPLSGVSHMTPQEDVAENLLRVQVDFLREALG